MSDILGVPPGEPVAPMKASMNFSFVIGSGSMVLSVLTLAVDDRIEPAGMLVEAENRCAELAQHGLPLSISQSGRLKLIHKPQDSTALLTQLE